MTGFTFFFGWEITLIEWLQSFMGDFMSSVAKIITWFGAEYILVAVIGFLYWCYNKELGRYAATNLMVAVVVNPLVKNIFFRRRPYMDNPSVRCIDPYVKDADIYDVTAQGFSFPSGHAMNSVTLYGSIAVKSKKTAMYIGAAILILLVGLSRVALGVHYPTDILVGWVVGAGIIALMTFLQNKVKNRAILYGALLLVTLPGFFYCKSHDFFSAYGLMLGFFAGDLFEMHCVNFKNTKVVWRSILRLIGGLAVFLGMTSLLKLPFPKEFIDSDGIWALLYRTARYAVSTFCTMGLYPMIFKILDKRGEVQNGDKV